jgi:hypothetical protein
MAYVAPFQSLTYIKALLRVLCIDCHLRQTDKVSHNHETNGRNAQKTAAENEREKITI